MDWPVSDYVDGSIQFPFIMLHINVNINVNTNTNTNTNINVDSPEAEGLLGSIQVRYGAVRCGAVLAY